MTDSTTTTPVTSIRTVGVPVRDQDRALEFYTGVLGLAKSLDVDLGGGARWIEVTPSGGGTTIALVSAKPSAPAAVETGIRLCTPDADAMHAHLLKRGASADEVLRWPGVPPMFAFRDQDGNGLEIVQDA
jgi:catechol 2,3-dioxygenase-like lactoylglutathione lyase family enzyme